MSVASLIKVARFALMLLRLLPDAVAAWRAWERATGMKLTAPVRKDLAEKLRAGVKHAAATKDTSQLEALFRPAAGGGKEPHP